MNTHTGHASHLFALGADARLRGEPEWSACDRYDTQSLRWWRKGWLEADRHWGRAVSGRWHFPPLPPVRQDTPTGHELVGG